MSLIKRLLHTTSLKANIVANFLGTGWSAVLSVLFVPLYLKYIGPEGYGLIGIFASLQVVLSLLDSGLSTTLNKEMSRLSVIAGSERRMRNVVKTLGSVYWMIALTAGFIAVIASPFLAKYWVQPQQLTVQIITYSFLLLSATFVFQFPISFYTGGLLGLQRQVVLNILRIVFATLRNGGAALVLMFVSDSILAFFTWILAVTAVQSLAFRFCLWFYLPKSSIKAAFDWQELKNVWRFAAGLTVVGLTSIMLTQVDKVILSKVLLLEQFGYYTFSFTVGSIAYMVVGPISQSYFPKFSVLLAEENPSELKRIYHESCQLVTLMVIPFALFMALFSKEVLFIWTQNEVTVENTWRITSVVSLAVAIHCLMYMPYMLCLSNNNTRLAFYTNIILLLFLIPGTIYSATHYGGVGGALCWLFITVVYFFINPILIHKLFLKGQALNWYWNDTFKPIIGCIILMLASRYIMSSHNFNPPVRIVMLISIGFIGFCLTLLSSKELKANFVKFVRFRLK